MNPLEILQLSKGLIEALSPFLSKELVLWMQRSHDILPSLINTWQMVETQQDPQARLSAALDMVRAIEDRRAREQIVEP